MKLIRTRVAYHIIFWICVSCILTINHLDMEIPSFDLITRTFIVIGLTIIPVYLHFHIFEKYFSRKRYGIYLVFLILILAAFVIAKNLIFVTFYDSNLNIFRNIYFIFTYIFITTALKLSKAGFEQKLLIQKIKAQHVQTELQLLKSQINPHFFFNTLNNLFGMVRKLDEHVAGSIAHLSHLMRYMIYESKVDIIELEKEVLHILSLIELQKLRFSKEDDIAIDFKIDGDISKIMIPPMLLMPFVENAFKHGISLEKFSFITILLVVRNKSLHFSIKNSIHAINKKAEKNYIGLGLKNAKRRLELIFPKKHELIIKNSNKEFNVKLKLDL